MASECGAVVGGVTISTRISAASATGRRASITTAATAHVSAASAPIQASRSRPRAIGRWRRSEIDVLIGPRHRIGDLEARIADVAKPVGAILLEAPPKQPANRRRRCGRQCRQVRLPRQHRGQQLGHVVAGKRASPGQHFVEHAAERPDVGACVERLSTRLLGTHVGGGAEDDTRVGHGQ